VPAKAYLSTDVYAVILTWAITLTLVAAIALSIGFGPAGVIAGKSVPHGMSREKTH